MPPDKQLGNLALDRIPKLGCPLLLAELGLDEAEQSWKREPSGYKSC